MRWAAILLALAACYSPSPPSGVPCGPGDSCPAGLTCTNGVCGGDPGDAAIVVDAACGSCSADGTTFLPCTGAAITCALGCSSTGGDHCVRIVPSNEIDPSGTSMTEEIVVAADTFVDTDTGEWTGGLVRPATIGGGVMAGIRFTHVTSTKGARIGVFSVSSFTLQAGASLQFHGSRAAAILGEGPIVIAGVLDGSAGCDMDRSCAGPGGGTGSRMGAPATGGCAAGDGVNTLLDDGGGGGGGGGEPGTAGGTSTTAAGGSAGASCINPDLIPLRGGGGGGAGGAGSSAFSKGGGGGGAIELVSQTAIEIAPTGLVYVGGDGGDGGHSDAANAGAGAGGGGGGGILLEAPMIDVTGKLIANGGGGGGGGNSQVGDGANGANASRDASVAVGGTGVATPIPGNGGNGGAGSTAATAGQDATNGGGGGGARGAIRVNAKTKTLGGTISPATTTGALTTQ